jgi:hypothetical protein
MNLINEFESKPFQDVGTFNSIFKTTPILGFEPSLEVTILGMTPTGRKILVGETEIVLNLAAEKKVVTKVKVQKTSNFAKPEKAKELSTLYKELSPSEFMLYSAIKELGEVYGVSQISQMVNLSLKTCTNSLKVLHDKKLVEVSTAYRGISKISLTQEIK